MPTNYAADYGGARGSNAGDQFHELWALQQILGLLKPRSTLSAVTVEGIPFAESQTTIDAPTWDGVDCALLHGDRVLDKAARVELVQLKYSGSSPSTPWTIARLCASTRTTGNNSVLRRLGDDFAHARSRMKPEAQLVVRLVSNQPAGSDILALLPGSGASAVPEEDRCKVQLATGLDNVKFADFLNCLDLGECGSLSRFGLDDNVTEDVIALLGDDVRGEVEHLQAQVRTLMLPERLRELVDERKLLVWFGLGGRQGLFPCPPAIEVPKSTIERVGTREVLQKLEAGVRTVLVHGEGGCGKTTLTQQLASRLPHGSVAVTYDCYGAGSYMHSEDKRHLPERAFLQIINDVAVATELPLLLPRSGTHPTTIETFLQRMTMAGRALELSSPGAILLVIVDAADNTVTAAESAVPVERPFIHDIAGADLNKLPSNVRFVVSARTARKSGLGFPVTTDEVLCRPFTETETRQHLIGVFPDASNASISSFHDLTGGNPRVQSYALKASGGNLDTLFEALLPNGRTLADVIDASFTLALKKLGRQTDLDRLTAALAFLPTPASVSAVAAVSGTNDQLVRDFAADLAPGIGLSGSQLTVSDEDFEDHIAKRSQAAQADTVSRIAEHFWSHYRSDPYCSTYVVDFLVKASRISDIFTVLDVDGPVAAVGDPLLRREIQIRRLTLALATCREAGDIVKAVQTILIGAEAQHDEGAFYDLVDKEVDLSVEFSGPSLLRRTLLDRDRAPSHGSVLAHSALSASLKDDRVGTLHYLRMYDAWISKRPRRKDGEFQGRHVEWKIEDRDIAALIEAVFRIAGVDAAIRDLQRWTPPEVRLRVGLDVVSRLIADGHGQTLLEFAAAASPLGPWRLLITVQLALAGHDIDHVQLARDVGKLRAKFIPSHELGISYTSSSWFTEWLRLIVAATEILYVGGQADAVRRTALKLLRVLTKDIIAVRSSDASRVDAIMRLWMLQASLDGKPTTADAFLEYAHGIGAEGRSVPKPSKGKRAKKPNTYEQDQEQQRTDRKLRVLFGVYHGRLDVMQKAVAGTLLADDLASLGSRTHSYELDSDYEAVYLRQVAARSISELLFLRGIQVPALCEAALRAATKEFGTYHGRETTLLSSFRLRREFHSDLLTILAIARNNAKARRARASEKMAELVALARFVFPFSRPDAEAFFSDAVTIAKEIDEEAIDQIEFVARASKVARSASSEGDDDAAGKFAAFAAAASVRLDGHDGFSWDDVVRGLTRLHAPTAFACTARWMDDGTTRLHNTLPPLLQEMLALGQLEPTRATALSMLVDGPDAELIKAVAAHGILSRADGNRLAEELARASLLADGQLVRIEQAKVLLDAVGESGTGYWLAQARQLVAFDATRPAAKSEKMEDRTPHLRGTDEVSELANRPFAPANGISWRQALEDAVRAASKNEKYRYPSTTLTHISNSLRAPSDRVPFLDALTSIDEEIADSSDWSLILSRVLKEWEGTPAVQLWCRQKLPAVISAHLAAFSRWLRYRQSNLDELLERTEADGVQRTALLLDGIAESGARMGSAALFGVASRIVDAVNAVQAREILDWYLDRLVSRLPAEDRDTLTPIDVPATLPEALSRLLYGFFSDIDTRVRWRTAHAARCLGRLEDVSAVTELFAQYGRTSDRAFRDPKSPFYDLGARLWLTLTAYRLSEENAHLLTGSKDVLMQAALSTDLPHVVIREYAKRALLAAYEGGALSLTSEEQGALASVNQPKQRSRHKTQRRSFGWSKDRAARRFGFDEMDTLPYWYSDLLNIFPQAPGDEILAMAERWILDIWKAPIDVNKWVMEPRRDTRLSDRGYDLWSHRHGSLPTVERYSIYLEWHAMLCVAGELLAAFPVGPKEYGEDRFQSWLTHFLPTQPPRWLSDLRRPTPLHPHFWWQDSRSDAGWLRNCRNDEYLEALGLLSTAPEGWIVVDANISSDHPTREQRCHVHSALVSPATAAALTRALQTTRDPWDFRIPDEDDDLQFDQSPYRLTGWLGSWHGDSRFDSHDPLRFDVRAVQSRPGKQITEFLRLGRRNQPQVQWIGKGWAEPSFIYEAWSDEAPSEHEPERVTKSEGWRLLAKIDHVAEFLTETGDDLICEISIERRLRSQYSRSYEPEAKQKKHFKILVLARDGTIKDFRGDAGVWKKAGRRVPA